MVIHYTQIYDKKTLLFLLKIRVVHCSQYILKHPFFCLKIRGRSLHAIYDKNTFFLVRNLRSIITRNIYNNINFLCLKIRDHSLHAIYDKILFYGKKLRGFPLHEQIAVQPLTAHLRNHPSKTNTTYWWRSKNELISDVLLLSPTHGLDSIGRPARAYLHKLCADTGCSLEDLPGGRDGQRERDRQRETEREWGEICAVRVT